MPIVRSLLMVRMRNTEKETTPFACYRDSKKLPLRMRIRCSKSATIIMITTCSRFSHRCISRLFYRSSVNTRSVSRCVRASDIYIYISFNPVLKFCNLVLNCSYLPMLLGASVTLLNYIRLTNWKTRRNNYNNSNIHYYYLYVIIVIIYKQLL